LTRKGRRLSRLPRRQKGLASQRRGRWPARLLDSPIRLEAGYRNGFLRVPGETQGLCPLKAACDGQHRDPRRRRARSGRDDARWLIEQLRETYTDLGTEQQAALVLAWALELALQGGDEPLELGLPHVVPVRQDRSGGRVASQPERDHTPERARASARRRLALVLAKHGRHAFTERIGFFPDAAHRRSAGALPAAGSKSCSPASAPRLVDVPSRWGSSSPILLPGSLPQDRSHPPASPRTRPPPLPAPA
jgi:hypothetical protein